MASQTKALPSPTKALASQTKELASAAYLDPSFVHVDQVRAARKHGGRN